MRFLRTLSGSCLFICSLLMSPWVAAEEASPDQLEFFEKRIRPLLIEHCQECHGSKQQKGGLRVDSLGFLEKGGETGPAINREEPDKSLLLEALLYDPSGYQMPPSGKLSAETIADVQTWLKMGAPWPLEETAVANSSGGIDLVERARHWSFQPVQVPATPSVLHSEAALNFIDAFILHRLEAEGVSPSPVADRRTLARRLSFDLRGLPPSVEEVNAFVHDPAPDAYERLVDRWLASPAYGERWGRHWLDLVRYAETYGHEFDYEIEHPTPYRDYVVRAWNADLPYGQFIREHIAGDLLPNPRRNPADQKNESVIGTAFWWFSQGKHSPVDIRQEECDLVDNQIDVFGKTFLGLTIACARCHDHKFDAITAKDYYALAGYLQSSRLHVADRHPPEVTLRIQQELALVDQKAKAAILDQTFATLQGALSRLPQITAEMGNLADDPGHPFSPLKQLLRVSDPEEFRAQRQALLQRLLAQNASRRTILEQGRSLKSWNDSDYGDWLTTEFAYGAGPVAVAKPVFQPDARHPIVELAVPGVAHTSVMSGKLRGTLRSPTFSIQHRYLDVLVHKSGGRENSGRGHYKHGLLNVIVDGFQIIRNPLYGHLSQPIKHGHFSQWYRVDLGKFQGQHAYLEIEDLDEGYVVLEEVYLSDGPLPPRAINTAILELLQQETITNGDQLLRAYRDLLASTISTWQSCCDLNATQADLLNPLLRHCRNDSGAMVDELIRWAQQRAELENRIPVPDLTLAMIDGSGENEFLLVRGNPKKPGEAVARRFLEVFTSAETVSEGAGSGREKLAEAVADPTNPLTARVLVNRLWQHHFGRGLVTTPDDFGKMGQAPSHPELLDALATEFIRSNWSIKRMQRLMVLSQTYQQSSRSGNVEAEERDPQNLWLHRQNRQRLEGEAIRDALLVLSRRLDDRMGGPSVLPHLTPFMEGRGRPGTSGPLDGDGRRSLYINVRRNFLSPFFLAFDFPTPFTTMGRRSTSNVPAQALTMMNNPLVVQQARQWAERTADVEPSARVEKLYEMAFARLPSPEEQIAALSFVNDGGGSLNAWSDLCHVLLNTKEFVFVE